MIFDDWNRHNYLHQGDRFEVLGHSISAQIELQKRGKKLSLLCIKINYFSVASLMYSIYISQEFNYNFATICFMSRDLNNHQATKIRVCTLVVFSAGGRKHLHTIINKNHGLFTKGRSMVMYAIKTSEPVIQSGASSRTCTSLSINASPLRVNSS